MLISRRQFLLFLSELSGKDTFIYLNINFFIISNYTISLV